MTDLKPGDTVQWWETFRNTKHEPRMMTCTVLKVFGGKIPWATMRCDGDVLPGATWVRDVAKLTRVDPMHTPVASSAQQPDESTNALGSMAGLTDEADVMIGWSGALE